MQHLIHRPIKLFCIALAGLAIGACTDDTSTSDARTKDAAFDAVTHDAVTHNDVNHNDADPKTDTVAPGGLLVDHVAPGAFASIPKAALDAARTKLGKIFYGHTSHGSQIVTGLNMLKTKDGTKYAMPTLIEPGGDLGHKGDTAWVTTTKAALSKPGHGIKMVVWSWCGGASDNTTAGINTYLTEMDKLEKAHPGIRFVYMTGHLDGTGPSGSLYKSNNQIRAYCKTQGKVLYDFADIESYDPAGKYYPNEDDSCSWCTTWCSAHTCPTCGSCAHSHCFNCYQKGESFWWMLARLSGWAG